MKCNQKIVFRSKWYAKKAKIDLEKKYDTKFQVYKCNCWFFHLHTWSIKMKQKYRTGKLYRKLKWEIYSEIVKWLKKLRWRKESNKVNFNGTEYEIEYWVTINEAKSQIYKIEKEYL